MDGCFNSSKDKDTCEMRVEFYRHCLTTEDKAAVLRVLDSVFLTTGPIVRQFEGKLCEFLGCQAAVGVSSCTAALFLTLKAWGIGPGDEVVTTPLTFIATANAILHTGATPIFVDVEEDTANIDVTRIEQAITPRTKAIIPVHLYGQMCDMERLQQIARAYRLRILEDAAHCIEGTRRGYRPGELGDAAAFSFYATKNLTCGEGGAVASNDSELVNRIRQLSLHGMSKSAADRYTARYQHWDMERLGYKCNLTDIQGALLLHQMDRLQMQRQQREQICKQYEEAFSQLPDVEFPRVRSDTISARHLFTIWVDRERRDEMLARLQDAGVGVAVNYRAIHLLAYYARTFGYRRGQFPVAERIGDRTITLPLYPTLTSKEVEHVISSVRRVLVG
jgi:UDP-4-amino-4-deoxy-L-arabinose-oxoglutarate aminotransferase